MNRTIMAYTLLKEYRKLGPLIDSLSTNITTGAVKSYFGGQSGDILTQLCDLLEYRRVLFNAKTMVKKAFSELSPFDKQIYKLYFLKNLSTKRVAEVLNVNNMQVYRAVKMLPNHVLARLEALPYFDEFCKEDYRNARFIKSAYELYLTSDKKLVA